MPQCYLCEREADTRDHVPPRAFFDVLPTNMPTLPACSICNASYAKDEEYFRTIVVAACCGTSQAANRVWSGSVSRSLGRKAYGGLRKRLVGSLVTVELDNELGEPAGKLPGLVVEGGRVARVVRKIMRGLFFHKKEQTLADCDLIIFRGGDVKLDVAQITRRWSERDMGEVFRFRWQFDDKGGAIWIEFYRTQWWLALTGNRARNYPTS